MGSILAGLGGLSLFSEWNKKRKIDSNIEKYKKLYPRELISIEFYLVHYPLGHKNIYILDKRNTSQHWIANWETFTNLAFTNTEAVSITEKEFKKYTPGTEVNINNT